MSYRRKLILTFMLVNLIPLTATYLFFSVRVYTTQRNLVISDVQTRIENSTRNLNTLLTEHSQRLQIVGRHPRLQAVLRSPVPLHMSTSLFDFYFDLQNLYHAFGGASPFWRMTIYSLNSNVLSGTFIRDARMMDSFAMQIVLANPSAEYIWTASECEMYLYIIKPEITLQRQIYAISKISLSLDRVRQYFAGYYPDGTQVFFQIPSNIEMQINLFGGGQIHDPGNYHVITVSELDGGLIFGYIPVSYLTGQLLSPLLGLTVGYFSLMLMFALLTVRISHLLSKRLEKLLGRVSHDIDILIENDDKFLNVKGTDEFARIDHKFKELLIKVKHYYKENSRIEMRNKALELELLQALINPHFLYNSLGSIKSAFDNQQLAATVDSLIKYYRIALNRGNSMLCITQEIEMVCLYMEIQKFAYEADFKYDIQIAEEIKGVHIPKNIIQPLVENALMHGITRQPGDCITITGYADGEYVLLIVSDNGVGMTPERLKCVLSGMNTDMRVGYGMFNVMQRVKLIYGEGCGLEVKSTKGHGTTVSLRIKPVKL